MPRKSRYERDVQVLIEKLTPLTVTDPQSGIELELELDEEGMVPAVLTLTHLIQKVLYDYKQSLDTQARLVGELEASLTAQTRLIRELEIPVIQVWEGVVVLPLVGAVDSERARHMTENLLNGITTHQAEQVIIDITGVPVVDTSVANHLLQAIKAARLLGARCLLVGIKSEVAQAMVHLGIDLSGVVTRANLQAGIEYVLAQMGLGIASLSSDLPPAKGRRALSSNILPSAEHQTVQAQEG